MDEAEAAAWPIQTELLAQILEWISALTVAFAQANSKESVRAQPVIVPRPGDPAPKDNVIRMSPSEAARYLSG